MTCGEPTTTIDEAVAALREVGVVLCFIPAVPGLGIHGATRWVNGRPVIQLSLLWKSDDQLWFTLFHELGHVLLHGDKALYLNGEPTTAEEEANAYASNLLIPPEFVPWLPRKRDIAAVQALATGLGIAPSIVLGRAQRETRDCVGAAPQAKDRVPDADARELTNAVERGDPDRQPYDGQRPGARPQPPWQTTRDIPSQANRADTPRNRPFSPRDSLADHRRRSRKTY